MLFCKVSQGFVPLRPGKGFLGKLAVFESYLVLVLQVKPLRPGVIFGHVTQGFCGHIAISGNLWFFSLSGAGVGHPPFDAELPKQSCSVSSYSGLR